MPREGADYHTLISEAARRDQLRGPRPADQFRSGLVNRKLAKPKVDPAAIAKILQLKADDEKAKAATQHKKKQELLRKRQEQDGGAYARRILKNQKATVKVSCWHIFIENFHGRKVKWNGRKVERSNLTNQRHKVSNLLWDW